MPDSTQAPPKSNPDRFAELISDYVATYELPEGDGDTGMNMDVWHFIQMADDFSEEERRKAISYLQSTVMAAITKEGKTIWSELFCFLALLYEKIEDQSSAYYFYGEAIIAPGVDSEIYRTYYVSMLHFQENAFTQEMLLNRWMTRYPKNERPYREAIDLYFKTDKSKCLEPMKKLKEFNPGLYEAIGLKRFEEEYFSGK